MLKVKIVQVVTRSDNIGGAQMHVRDLSVELRHLGYDVCVLVGGEGPFVRELKECGIPVFPLRHLIRPVHPYHDWCAFLEIRRMLMMLQPSLVAAHTSKAGLIGRIAAWSLGIPVVFTVHGWSFLQTASKAKKHLYISAEKIAGLVSGKVITVSEYDRGYCLEHRIVSPDKVITVYNGIPDIPLSRINQSVDPPRFIMTARLEKPKNHIHLLKAFNNLRKMDWRLDLVGEGPLRSEIEFWIKKLKLDAKVRMLGARRDIPQLLSSAQGFVLISDMEGLPISILEAIRAGLPVIASDVGGVGEIVKDKFNGYLIPRGNLDILTQRLEALIKDRELRTKMGLASRRRFEKVFKITDMVTKTLSVYSKEGGFRGPG